MNKYNHKEMKKMLLMIVGMFLAVPFFVFAQTVPSVTQAATSTQSSCIDLQYNMSYRSRDAKTNRGVSELQDFLITKKYLSGHPTGYFGATTLVAVKKFQSAVGLGTASTPGYGGVGAKTRAKIKAMTCGETATTVTHSCPALTAWDGQTCRPTSVNTAPICNSEQVLVNGECKLITIPYVCPNGTVIQVAGMSSPEVRLRNCPTSTSTATTTR